MSCKVTKYRGINMSLDSCFRSSKWIFYLYPITCFSREPYFFFCLAKRKSKQKEKATPEPNRSAGPGASPTLLSHRARQLGGASFFCHSPTTIALSKRGSCSSIFSFL